MRCMTLGLVLLAMGCGTGPDPQAAGSALHPESCDTAGEPSASGTPTPPDGGDGCVQCTDPGCLCHTATPAERGYACFGVAVFPTCDVDCSNDAVGHQINGGPVFSCVYCGATRH